MNPVQFISLLDLKARMSLKSEASKLYLSYLWWVIEPALWVLTFYFVFTYLLGGGRDIAFLMCGYIPFLWFSKSFTAGSNSIVQNRGLISQANIPKQFFIYESLQEVLYKQWLVFLVLFAALMFFGYMPNSHWFWIIPLILVQYLLIVLTTLIGAILVSYVRDVRMLISMFVIFLMFSSGIFWDIEQIADPVMRDMLLTWNPIAFLLHSYRQVLMYQEMYDWRHLSALATALLFSIGLMHIIYKFKGQMIASKVINS